MSAQRFQQHHPVSRDEPAQRITLKRFKRISCKSADVAVNIGNSVGSAGSRDNDDAGERKASWFAWQLPERRGREQLTLYLITFDLHGAPQPPGNLYVEIYRDIELFFGKQDFCKDFGQFCLVRSDDSVQTVKNRAQEIIDRKSNQFSGRDIVVFSVGDNISISRGPNDDDLRDFRRFFVTS